MLHTFLYYFLFLLSILLLIYHLLFLLYNTVNKNPYNFHNFHYQLNMIDIFKIILDEQNNDKFRKNCLIMRIIDNEDYEKYKDFYLQYYIVKIINDKLIEESIKEIKNNIEMYGALIEFIKDIVYEKKNIKIQKDIDIWKYEISKILN